MPLLFSINKQGNAVLIPEAIQLCPELAYLSDKELLCIIYAYDYYSIFRQFTEDERKRRARAKVFGYKEADFFEYEKIKKAVDDYRSLQYDHRRESIIVYKQKLQNIDAVISTLDEDETKKLSELMKTSAALRQAIRDLEAEINQSEEEDLKVDKHRDKMSWLEALQYNKDEYKAMKHKVSKLPAVKNAKQEDPKKIVSKKETPKKETGSGSRWNF